MALQKVNQLLALGLLATSCSAQTASSGMHWVATWASAQQMPRVAPPRPASAAPANAPANAPARQAPPSAFNNQTIRMMVRASVGGSRVRVHFSNAYGTAPLVIDSAHVALHAKDAAIAPGSDHALAFNGAAGVSIPPGAEMISDPVDITVPKLGELAVSVHVAGDTGPASTHAMALRNTYISKEGNFTSDADLPDAVTTQAWYWVSAVDVLAPAKTATVVTFGDSITDGATSTPGTDRSWPSVLAARLQANPATAHIAVANLGISGNRVLGDEAGVSALARFDRDVLAQAGVKWVVIMESINDIGGGAKQGTVSSAALINALKQMIERAHTHGIKVIGATLTPFQGAAYASPEGEAMRGDVNAFIRSGAFDAVFDFDQVTRDPASPNEFQKAFNDRDHLHPNDAGYKAMADSIDLSIFNKTADKVVN